MKRIASISAAAVLMAWSCTARADDIKACYPSEFVKHFSQGHDVLVDSPQQFSLNQSLAGQAECTYALRFHDCVQAGIKKSMTAISFAAQDLGVSQNVKEASETLMQQGSQSFKQFDESRFRYRVKSGSWFSAPTFSHIEFIWPNASYDPSKLTPLLKGAAGFCQTATADEQWLIEQSKAVVNEMTSKVAEKQRANEQQQKAEKEQAMLRWTETCQREKKTREEYIARRMRSQMPYSQIDQQCREIGITLPPP